MPNEKTRALYRLRAAELRELAGKLKQPEDMKTLLNVAFIFNRLAAADVNLPAIGETPDETVRPN